MSTRDERETQTAFAERYAMPRSDAAAEVERRVIGAVWGANGYTTRDQADELGRLLGLGPDRLLLDVGTGRGWPGLYLAQQTGCAVIGTDMPVEGLRSGTRRAARRGLDDRAAFAAAAAGSQPFAPATFDGIVHSDVLC